MADILDGMLVSVAMQQASSTQILPVRVLANAMPKTGTHLLLEVLAAVPGLRFSGIAVDWGEPERALAALRSMAVGQFSKAHIPFMPPAPAFIEEQGFLMVTMIRDPRDAVVSFFHYIMRQPRHYLHASYAKMENDHERLLATILGFEDAQGELPVQLNDIGWRLRNWLGWKDQSYCLALHFEDLVGSKGGGDALRQREEIAKLLRHLGVEPEPFLLTRIADQAFNPKAHSFRKGKVGDWRNCFSEAHKAAFKRVANWALVHYGYENDDAW